MLTVGRLRTLALSFPEATEAPHFEKTSFRIKRRVFATFDPTHQRLCVKLSEIDQDVFCSAGKPVIYPASGTWGKQGWTVLEVATLPRSLAEDALTTAYCWVAPPTLAAQVRPNS